MKDNLGDRMKQYEAQTTSAVLLPHVPVLCRVDGRAFHTFTRGLKRPYDTRLSNLMTATTKYLVEESGAVIGYTQSDEISLMFYALVPEQQIFFNGRIFKMTSMLSAMATWYFNQNLADNIPERKGYPAMFDCRIWNVPSEQEAVNYFVWRERDATKNSISMAAQAYYSHNELMGKNSSDKQELLWQKGVNWNDYPAFFKRGTFVQRRKVERSFTEEEIQKLPERHPARANPGMTFMRTQVDVCEAEPLERMPDRIGFIFGKQQV